MPNLIKLELGKLKKNTTFWVVGSIFSMLFIFSAIIFGNIDYRINFFSDSNSVDFSKYIVFPNIWTTITWVASWFSHLWALLLIVIIGNEFSKNVDEQSTNRKFWSKIIFILIIPAILFILLIVMTTIIGLNFVSNASFSQMAEHSYSALLFYLQAVITLSFAFLIVTIFNNKTGLSILIYISYVIFEIIVKLFFSVQFNSKAFIQFLPLKAINSLTPRPSFEIALSTNLIQQLQFKDTTSYFSLPKTIIISIVYLIVFWLLTYYLIKRKDKIKNAR